jgi:hypothetical protein
MSLKVKVIKQLTARSALPGAWDSTTASGAVTLTKLSGQFQQIDPGGAGRDVTLPDSQDGDFFVIANAADAAEALTVKDSAASTIGSVSQNDMGIFYVDSVGAWQVFWMISGAPS